jgi:AraC-like DNA-binding protein
VDQRDWCQTGRPGEWIALTEPLPGSLIMSVVGSDRQWAELHQRTQTVCLVHANQPGIGAEWRSGHQTFRTGAGELMVMEVGGAHYTRTVYGKAAFSVVQMDTNLLDRLAEALELRQWTRLRPNSMVDVRLGKAITRLVGSCSSGSELLEIECGLLDVARSLWRIAGEGPPASDPVVHRGVRRARDLIRARYLGGELPNDPSQSQSLRLKELAHASGLAAGRFPHAFRHWLGISPHAYANLCRLSAARRLLAGGKPATMIAADLGFADLAHFSRRFAKQYGLSPQKWKAALGPGSRAWPRSSI